MTREQIVKISQEGARKVAKPTSGTPASKKHIARLAELKKRRKAAQENLAPVEYQERLRA
ncbi:hypothetical protein [Bradyrhizobium stylosanthis]|uniref:Uncharacterized protein n=1 Tax=Bradyrhizobium stylosanthis TaxID=1803665 RepID=A0A560DKB2_9BRAD|nr:hypothetical protein [Bradyrhizobium stylosanthis]TWA97536.1 hypothetical protein FBZ96_106595 [Bradyrhizobium stylosanthis]